MPSGVRVGLSIILWRWLQWHNQILKKAGKPPRFLVRLHLLVRFLSDSYLKSGIEQIRKLIMSRNGQKLKVLRLSSGSKAKWHLVFSEPESFKNMLFPLVIPGLGLLILCLARVAWDSDSIFFQKFFTHLAENSTKRDFWNLAATTW
ncbi:hypothetical protein KL948_004409 [Ogataea haglerorum]|nr:hypothetical protein KL948_004409 [Ogataea haglerorum]